MNSSCKKSLGYVSPIKLGLLKVYLLVGILKNGSNINSIFIKAKKIFLFRFLVNDQAIAYLR